MENYTIINELGRGSYGVAHLVERNSDGKQLVAKRLYTTRGLTTAQQEATFLQTLRHPNIVGYVESFVEEEHLILIMQYADGGDLQSWIEERKVR